MKSNLSRSETMVVREKGRWETKGLDCWPQFKEFLKGRYEAVATAHDQGLLTVLGTQEGGIQEALGGGDHNFGGEPYGATCAYMGLSVEFMEAAEAKGFARDTCAYCRINLGAMYLDKYAFGGTFPKVDFGMRKHTCDTHAKWSLLHSEYLKVPYLVIDGAPGNEFDSEQSLKNKAEYHIAQQLDAIEEIEKLTGREFNDEIYIQSVYNNYRCRNLWAQVCILNQNIPAPLDQKSMYTLFEVAFHNSVRKGAVELMETLRDEVEDRVKNKIAAVATERFRIGYVSQPPYYALRIFRYLEKYGAVAIGSRYCFGIGEGTTMVQDGKEVPIPTLEEQGIVLKTREDAVRAAVNQTHLAEEIRGGDFRYCGHRTRESLLRLIREWHCDAAIMHFNRGCQGWGIGEPQLRLALLENDIPTLTFEGNVADSREWDDARSLARLDAFFESQGLEKLED
jgi:benzoyl-CoA reductase subunit B